MVESLDRALVEEVHRTRRIAPLDGLRAYAISIVVGFHAGLPGFAGGSMGVTIFFVLSGFLITSILLRPKALTSGGLGRFYLRRLLRLYPALIVVVVSCGIYGVLILRGSALHYMLYECLASVTYTTDYYLGNRTSISDFGYLGHTWSLAVEEQFYLAWPLLLMALLRFARRHAVAVAAFLVTLGTLWRTYQSVLGHHEHVALTLDARTSDLLIGCLVAIGLRNREWIKLQGRLLDWAAAAAVMVVVASTMFRLGALIPFDLSYTLVGMSTAALIARVVDGDLTTMGRILCRVLSLRPLSWIAAISYSMYLWHVVIFVAAKRLLPMDGVTARVIWAPVLVVLLLVLSVATYTFVERPFLRIKDRLVVAVPKPGASRDAETVKKSTVSA